MKLMNVASTLVVLLVALPASQAFAQAEAPAEGAPIEAIPAETANESASAEAPTNERVGPVEPVEPAPNAAAEIAPEASAEVAAKPPKAKKSGKPGHIPKSPELMADGEKERNGKHPADAASATWKPGTGLIIGSKDGLFSVGTRVRVQVRGAVANESGSSAEMGILLRRARLQFKGHSFGKHNKFKAEFAFSPRDLRLKEIDGNNLVRETPLLTWYMEFDQNPNATIRVGQYKIPYSRQRVISSGNLQMVDRSIANGEFNLDRDIGLDIRSKDLFGLGKFKYYAGVYNGEGRSAFGFGSSDLMYLARVEYLPFGLFKDYSEGDFERLSRPGLSIGAAYSYAKNAEGTRVNRNGAPADGGTTDVQGANVDMTFKYKGFAASGELFWRDGSRNPANGATETDPDFEFGRNGIGWFAQAGYLLPKQIIEVTGRYGQILPADESSLTQKSEAGLAFSYYAAQHPFKIQGDIFQLWDESEFADGETRARVQMQYSF